MAENRKESFFLLQVITKYIDYIIEYITYNADFPGVVRDNRTRGL